jgi:cytochrome c553
MKRALAAAALCLHAAVTIAAELPRGDAEKGKGIASQVCAACHGADGNSPTPANPRLGGQIEEYTYKQLMNFKGLAGKKPERESPVMGAMAAGLSPEDMRNVAAYFAGQQESQGQAKNKETVFFGRKLYRGGDGTKGLPACAGCHGADGSGIPAQYPRLAGQYAEYTTAQLKAFRDGQRTNDPNRMMRTIAARMNDKEIASVSDYIAGLR